jgi:hypothetical protein
MLMDIDMAQLGRELEAILLNGAEGLKIIAGY